MNKEDKYKILERLDFAVSNCDAKVSYLLAVIGIILTIVFTSDYSKHISDTMLYSPVSVRSIGWKQIFRFIEACSLYLFFSLIGVSLYCIYNALLARTDTDLFQEKSMTKKSLLFFGDIAERTFENFIKDDQAATDQTLLRDIESQVFINSKICSVKFKYYNYALNASSVALIVGVIYVALSLSIPTT